MPDAQNNTLVNFFQFVSLLEFSLLLYFASGVIDGDLYKMFFLSFALLKHLPEQSLKLASKNSPALHQLNLRPIGAKDCNSLNKGGRVGPNTTMRRRRSKWDDRIDGRPGMPSGHCTVITMYLTLHVSNILYLENHDKIRVNARSITLFVILTIGTLLMGFARTYLQCHTLPQVIAGYLLGFILGIIAFWTSQKLSSKYPTFKKALLHFYTKPFLT